MPSTAIAQRAVPLAGPGAAAVAPPAPDGLQRLLASYAAGPRARRDRCDRRFGRALASSLALCLALGFAASGVEAPPFAGSLREAGRRAVFVLNEPAPRPVPLVQPPAPPTLPEPAVADLTRDVQPAPTAPAAVPAAEQAPPAEAPATPPRKVYGLRRVYARGLGGDAAGDGAILTKRGNTLDREPDSLTAMPFDLAGTPLGSAGGVGAATGVTRAPELTHRVTPAYTPEMIAARAEGIVKARLLVDAGGRVTEVEVIEDIGHGSREAAAEAFRSLRFRPALRGEDPVAAWILMTCRFVLQD